jgi:hypothetical protein
MKIMRYLLVIIASALYSCGAFAESAEEILSACRPMAEAEIQGKSVKFPPGFPPGMCWGAFSILQSVIMHDDDNGKPTYRVCAPANHSRTQLINVFVDYGRRNPKRFHEEFFSVVIDALSEAFPCKNSK